MKLKVDKIGASSGIVYGRHGQEVNILDRSRDMWLVEIEGVKQRFFVWPHDLTDEIKTEKPIIVEEKKIDKPLQFLPKGQRLKDSPSSLLFDIDPQKSKKKKK